MAENLLRNGGFELDWSVQESHFALVVEDDGYDVIEVGNIHTPPNWLTWFDHRGTYSQPEVRDSWERANSGEKGMLFFTFNRKHCGGFMQTVSVGTGSKVRLSAFAHAWSNHDGEDFEHGDDPKWSEGAGYDCARWLPQDIPPLNGDPQNDAMGNFAFVLGIDPTGGTDPTSDAIVWGDPAFIYNCYDAVPAVEAVAQSDTVTVYLRSETLWAFKHSDAYWDDVALEVVSEPSGRGRPRVQYKRVYNVIPSDATEQRAAEIFLEGWIRSRETAGGSYDDAGVGDLDDKTAVLWDIPIEERQSYTDFYARWYPTATVEFAGYDGQALWLSPPTTHVPHVVTSPYGEDRGTYIHYGLDLRSSWAVWGDELLACVDGEVVLAGVESGREYFGHQVQIRTFTDEGTVLVRYAHLVLESDDGIYVDVGDEVRRGDKIGRPDNTGESTGDHLHLDVRVNGSYIDPTPLIQWGDEEPPEEGPQPPETSGPTVSFHVQAPESGL